MAGRAVPERGATGAADRVRVLWITEEPPDRALGGGNIRQAHLIEGLARRADVTLLMFGTLGDAGVRNAVADVVEVQGIGVPAPRRRLVRRSFDQWIAARGPREVVLPARRRRAVAARLGPLEARADLVVASHLGMAVARPARPTARWAAQLHHVTSARVAQERSVTAGARQRWLLARDAAHARRVERRLLDQLDAVVVVSDEDAQLLTGGHAPRARIVVAPNGVDVDRYRPAPLPPEPSIVMTGSFVYGPNVDGARGLCDEVLPRVRAAVPGATLALVGREPRDEVVALADREGVSLHADVPDMAPFLHAARVAVVPLRIGTGTRLKALEAMAAGRPVVGTSVGLEGLGLVDGVHAHLADDPDAFAAAIVRVLQDDDHAEALAAAGRAHVEAHFRWSAIADRFADDLLAGLG
jgi:glycosyltransferase involved in cell wall biosynthesis